MDTQISFENVQRSEIKNAVGLVVCGPCACGKSEVASALAEHFNVPYLDADTYHPEENIKKMSNGIPLTDEDRFPWLATVRKEMILQMKIAKAGDDHPVVIVAACSALTKKYREILRGTSDLKKVGERKLSTVFVFLNCSEKVLQSRIQARQGHFMKGNMLASQLAILEHPFEETANNQAVVINGDAELQSVVKEGVEKLQLLFRST